MAGLPPALVLPVDVWSDVACPWCYVGKARLDAAIAAVEARPGIGRGVKVEVKWHAYLIDRATHPHGEDYLAYNERRWGSDGWTGALRRSGARNGLKFADWRWWPNTMHAHRFLHLASLHGLGSPAKQRLLELTYEEGGNVSDVGVLVREAEAMGLPNAREYLSSQQGQQEVLEDDAYGKKKLKISGVPYFIINNKYTLSGAQEAAAFEHTMRQALESADQ